MSRSPCLQFSSMERRGLSAKSHSPCPPIFHTRPRGGGAMEHGASSCDATVDVEMLLSEYGDDDDDDEAGRTHGLLPRKLQLHSGRLEDGEIATAAQTKLEQRGFSAKSPSPCSDFFIRDCVVVARWSPKPYHAMPWWMWKCFCLSTEMKTRQRAHAV